MSKVTSTQHSRSTGKSLTPWGWAYAELVGSGGSSDNIPPTTSKVGSAVGGAGEDTAHIGLQVVWPAFSDLKERLAAEKLAAQADDDVIHTFTLRRELFAIKPIGHKSGGPLYAWALSARGVEVSIMNRAKPFGETPNVFVNVGSLTLMTKGLERVMLDLSDLIKCLGGELVKTQLSRVDFAIDLPGVSVEIFVDKLEQRAYVSRSRSSAQYGRDLPDGGGEGVAVYTQGRKHTGLTMGKKLHLRIYDKLEETRHDEEKRAFLELKRWGGKVESATRIEFQLRREVLRTFQVSSVEDWLRLREGILVYLMQDWVRFTEESIDEHNTTREKTAAEWLRAESIMKRVINSGVAKVDRVKLKRELRYKVLGDVIAGCMSTLLAVKRDRCKDLNEAVSHGWGLLTRIIMERGIDYLGRIENKRAIMLTQC